MSTREAFMILASFMPGIGSLVALCFLLTDFRGERVGYAIYTLVAGLFLAMLIATIGLGF